MKKMSILLVLMLLVSSLSGATTPTVVQSPTVKGTMGIDFASRQTPGTLGVWDVYTLDFRVVDTLGFQGTIRALPTVLSSRMGSEKQKASLVYNLNLQIANPANLSQKRTVGKMVGEVQVDKLGAYHYDQGTLRIAVDASGKAQGLESNFRGTAIGKPPKDESTLSKVKKQTLTMTRSVKGKTVSLIVKDYDIMTFRSVVLAAGPVRSYPETTVNGEMLYDYERSAWYFKNLSLSYFVEGRNIVDRLSGNIKWVESPQRKTNGQGQYEFDVRFNEPEQASNETAVFQKTTDEADFFSVDTALPSLTGTAKYTDRFSGETVLSSKVDVDLVGNNLTKLQVVNAFKLIFLIDVVPVNAE